MAKRLLYHGTYPNNRDSILEQGILHKFEGVYLTDSAVSAARWTGFKAQAMGHDSVVVFEVIVDEENISMGCDHSPLMQTIFRVGESYLHQGDIPTENIKRVYDFNLKQDGKH